MGKYIKKRKIQARIKVAIFLVIAVVIVICLAKYLSKLKPVELLESSNKVEEVAKKAWSEAYLTGKRTENEIETYVKNCMEKNEIKSDEYYIYANTRGVTVTKKPQALLVEAGVYKAGSNYTELLKSWKELEDEYLVVVEDGELTSVYQFNEMIDLVIDSSITQIGDEVFYKKTNINSVTVPDSVTSLGKDVFKESQIKHVIIGRGITELNGTFNNMKHLEKIQFTSSITAISKDSFVNTEALNSIIYIGNEYEFCNIYNKDNCLMQGYAKNQIKLYIKGAEINEFVVPSGIEILYDFLLYNYDNITSVLIPNTVKIIGVAALAKNNITSIVYDGTMEEWKKIRKDEFWDGDSSNYTIYCKDGKIYSNQ